MIKIFLSSTFGDMQYERDVIHNVVYPRLQSLLARQGLEVQFCDLRWGISADKMRPDEMMNKIMSVCADEIERCKPYFVLLVGERYGTVPEPKVLKRFARRYLLTDAETAGKSITELEYLCATTRGTHARVCVCLRYNDFVRSMPTDLRRRYVDDNRTAVSAFRAKVAGEQAGNVLHYGVRWDENSESIVGLEDFANKLYEALKARIAADYGTEVSGRDEQLREMDDCTARSLATQCVDWEDYKVLDAAVKTHRIVVVHGEEGCGKSCIVANLAVSMRPHRDTVCLFLGDNQHPLTADAVLHHLLYRLGADETDCTTGATQKLQAAMRKCYNPVVILDDVGAMPLRQRLELLRKLPLPEENDRFCLVLTTKDDDLPDYYFVNASVEHVYVQPFDDRRAQALVDILLAKQDKSLSAAAKQAFARVAHSTRPIYIALALDRLTMMNKTDYDAIERLAQQQGIDVGAAHELYILDLIRTLPANEEELARLVVHKVGESYGKGRVDALLALVAAGKESLRADEICTLLGQMGHPTGTLDLICMTHLLRNVLRADDGKDAILFAHRAMVKIIDTATYEDAKRTLFAHLDGIREDDASHPVRDRLYFVLGLNLEKYAGITHYLGVKYRQEDCFALFDKAFCAPKGRRIWMDKLCKMLDYAAVLDKQGFCTFGENVLYGVFGAINRATEGSDGWEYELMQRFYALCTQKMKVYNKDIDVYRMTYRALEKMGIACKNHEDTYKHYKKFYEMTDEALAIFHDYEHFDYLLSDHCHAIERIAAFHEFDAPKRAIELYDEAILLSSTMLEPSTDKKDLLAYQMHGLTCRKYRVVENMLYEKAVQLGWDYTPIIEEYCRTIVKDLTAGIEFCENTLSGFVQQEHCETPSSYIHLSAECHYVLGTYYRYVKNAAAEMRHLADAYEQYLEMYKLTASDVGAYLLRCASLALANCQACPPRARLTYLADAFDITNQALRRYPSEDVKRILGMLDAMNARMLKATMQVIFPDRDFDTPTPKELVLQDYEPAAERYDDVAALCQQYFECTQYSHQAVAESWNKEDDKRYIALESAMFQATTYLFVLLDSRLTDKWQQCSNLFDTPREGEIVVQSNDEMRRIMQLFETAYLAMSKKQMWPIMHLIHYLCATANSLSLLRHYTNYQPDYEPIEKCPLECEYMMTLANKCCALQLNAIYHEKKPYRFEPTDMMRSELQIYVAEAWADLRVFAFALRQGDDALRAYLRNRRYNEYKDWRNAYVAAVKMRHQGLDRDMCTVGKYLCEAIEETDVKRMLYYSNFYALVAAEYAYRTGRGNLAYDILHLGYDRYLEVGTLYMMRKYDRRRYLAEFDNLKWICLVRIQYQLRRDPKAFGRYYGWAFAGELKDLVRAARKKLKNADPSDPRLVEERHVPRWAK